MSTEQTWRINSTSSEATLALAAEVASRLRGREIIELVSDLGGGKTTFVRGLAKRTGYKKLVRSPSFTLTNQYKTQDKTIYHFDFYRLSDPGLMKQELSEVMTGEKSIIVIEWAKIVEDVLPPERLAITFKITGPTTRQITFKYPESLAYLVPEQI